MNRGNYMKLLKEICRGIAKTLGFIQDADKKIASNVAAAMRTNVEQIKEYEKCFEPGPPEPLSHLANNWRKMHGLPMQRKGRRR